MKKLFGTTKWMVPVVAFLAGVSAAALFLRQQAFDEVVHSKSAWFRTIGAVQDAATEMVKHANEDGMLPEKVVLDGSPVLPDGADMACVRRIGSHLGTAREAFLIGYYYPAPPASGGFSGIVVAKIAKIAGSDETSRDAARWSVGDVERVRSLSALFEMMEHDTWSVEPIRGAVP